MTMVRFKPHARGMLKKHVTERAWRHKREAWRGKSAFFVLLLDALVVLDATRWSRYLFSTTMSNTIAL